MFDIDPVLIRAFEKTIFETGTGSLHDPRFPFRADVELKGDAYKISIVDTRKKWWGKVLHETETREKPSALTIREGPAFAACCVLDTIIKDFQR